MTPDRLRGWLQRWRVGAASLQLRHDVVGDDSGAVFHRWDVEHLPTDADELVQLVLDVAGDYADSQQEAVRVSVEYLNDEDVKTAGTIHKAKTREAQTWDQANAADVSQGSIISQLLRHIEVQQKVLSGSNLNAFAIVERAMNVQQKVMERQAAQIQALADQVLELRAKAVVAGEEGDEEAAAETAEESRARARAFDRFAEIVPHVANGVLQYVATKQAGPAVNGAVNGAVHAAASVGES